MHELERHRIILNAVQERPILTVRDIAGLTGASEPTIRRDIAALAVQNRLKKVRGGAEALHPPQIGMLAARSFRADETINAAQKRAIAREAVKLCRDGEAIFVNGGTTTFPMVHHIAPMRLHVMTNSFPIAEYLIKHSKCTVMLPAGAVYREQNIILSPFDSDGTDHFYARRFFMGARGISPLGVMESDSLIIQSEQRLMRQADELVVLVDSSKFKTRSSLIICPLERVSTIITDDGIDDRDRRMVEAAGIELIIATVDHREEIQQSPTVA
jgi:DeoR family ulaG and ulaABCDEF operon transcriptional repressor